MRSYTLSKQDNFFSFLITTSQRGGTFFAPPGISVFRLIRRTLKEQKLNIYKNTWIRNPSCDFIAPSCAFSEIHALFTKICNCLKSNARNYQISRGWCGIQIAGFLIHFQS